MLKIGSRSCSMVYLLSSVGATQVPKAMLGCVCPIFLKRLPHRHDILRRHIALDIVNRSIYESASRHEVGDTAFNIFAYLFRSMVLVKDPLCIYTTTPESEIFAVLAFQFGRIHACCIDLYRVNNIQSDLR